MTTTPTQACGWELRCTEGSSNKYYRVLVVGTTVIRNHGRVSTRGLGQFQTSPPYPSVDAAVAAAARVTAEKEGRGYALSQDLVTFTVTNPADHAEARAAFLSAVAGAR